MKKLQMRNYSQAKHAKKVRAIVPQVARRFRKPTLQQQTETALSEVPRITNETVAEHREEVLKGARKYKYPLEHSKRKIVAVSSTILILAVVGFFIYTGLSLYRYKTTSLFMYRVTQIIPFPVAKAGSKWVSYESYLFELRHSIHYYETQQNVDFTDTEPGKTKGKAQLDAYRSVALQQVIDVAYVKELAAKNKLSVTEQEVSDAITMLQAQNQLTSDDDDELEAIMQKFFGWSVSDLSRRLKEELLAQKVAAKLDTAAYSRAQNVLLQLQNGADFAALAAQVSDDTATKATGGIYADIAITMKSQEVPPQVVRELAKLQPGQLSDIIVTPNAFEIVKLVGSENGKYKAAHIQINFSSIDKYIQPLEKKNPPKKFINVQPLK
ncbi:peptidylprolyl isomerase [Candidatus Saccharibacteria bacterium]|nr:MAG: peptidylprolyl isomerase [Candidatus Saccharibacteria bacterium]